MIKTALEAANEIQEENVRVDITYTGAPRYRIKVIAPDYKNAESVLKGASTAAVSTIDELGGKGEYHRHIEQCKGVMYWWDSGLQMCELRQVYDQETCPQCGGVAWTHVPQYSPKDPYGKYRRLARKG